MIRWVGRISDGWSILVSLFARHWRILDRCRQRIPIRWMDRWFFLSRLRRSFHQRGKGLSNRSHQGPPKSIMRSASAPTMHITPSSLNHPSLNHPSFAGVERHPYPQPEGLLTWSAAYTFPDHVSSKYVLLCLWETHLKKRQVSIQGELFYPYESRSYSARDKENEYAVQVS